MGEVALITIKTTFKKIGIIGAKLVKYYLNALPKEVMGSGKLINRSSVKRINGTMIEHYDLFAGIGGFSLALDNVFGSAKHIFVERDEFCQRL